MSDLNEELSLMLGKMRFEDEEENEELKEYAESSDAWFRGVMRAIRIINKLASDKAVVNDSIEQITEATGHVGHVRSMLKAVQIIHEHAADAEEFEEHMARITGEE